MPIGDYPPDWARISKRIREQRAAGQCECEGHCGLHRGKRCIERDGQEANYASGKVVLTVAHMNHYPPDCRDENLRAMCQTCHLRYDGVLHARNAHETKRGRRALRDLFELEDGRW